MQFEGTGAFLNGLNAGHNTKRIWAFFFRCGQPSEADIKVTRDLIRAGQPLKIEVLDHVIVGNPNFCSLRQLGFFYN